MCLALLSVIASRVIDIVAIVTVTETCSTLAHGHMNPVKGKLDKVETTYNDYCDLDTHHVHQFIEVIMK